MWTGLDRPYSEVSRAGQNTAILFFRERARRCRPQTQDEGFSSSDHCPCARAIIRRFVFAAENYISGPLELRGVEFFLELHFFLTLNFGTGETFVSPFAPLC